jgi:hypothetical protein
MGAVWEERLAQFELRFLEELELLKADIFALLNAKEASRFSHRHQEQQLQHTEDNMGGLVNRTNPSQQQHAFAACRSPPSSPSPSLSSPSSPSAPPLSVRPAKRSRVFRSGYEVPTQTHKVVRVRATFNFEGLEEDELSLPKGLELVATMREDDNWLWGQHPDGRLGIFPLNFVTVLEGDPNELPTRNDDRLINERNEVDSVGEQEQPPPPAGPKPIKRDGSQRRVEAIRANRACTSARTEQHRNHSQSSPQLPIFRPVVPRTSLKPTQRDELSRTEWHYKRKSIMLLRERSQTARLLAQWEKFGKEEP